MDFRILGPLEVISDGRLYSIGSGKQRALLAILVLRANEPVATDTLLELLWGERGPAASRKSLQVCVSRLRKALGAAHGRVVTQPNGYMLQAAPGELDLDRFEALAERGRRALAATDPERAAGLLREALEVWRGPALADLRFEAFAQPEIRRLEELRLATLEDRFEADLESGRHAELAAELEALVDEHPLRERLHRLRVVALYRAGRQAEALEAYRAARTRLIDELGVEPTPELQALEQAILTHDATLQTPVAPRRNRLPAPSTRTFGRESDSLAVAALLRRADVRLVTLVGPGGVGKTRLALEAARELEPELAHGAWFASLAATVKAEHIASAIAQALDVTPLEGETAEGALQRIVATKHGLLVLDNCEHLLTAAPVIGDLVRDGEALTVLATSREPLRLKAEHCYPVSPLQTPTEPHVLAVEESAAGSLFVERARTHDGSFELTEDNAATIAEICRRLDGLPLALELAAARTTMLDVEELGARLADALNVLAEGPRDAPDRQRTLRATIDWSHRLLSSEEAQAFARFAVFTAGATFEAAQAVTAADLDELQGLVDKQLLRREGSGKEARLTMLETVRGYALERLEDDEPDQTRARHCDYYLRLVERAEPELFTRGETEWLPKLDVEIDNLRAALEWSLRHDPTLALRLAGMLELFWFVRARYFEGLDWLETALSAAGNDAPTADRARARRAQARLLGPYGTAYNRPGSREELTQVEADALGLSHETGDPGCIAATLVVLAASESTEPLTEPLPERRRRALADEALTFAREAGDDRLIALALWERALSLPVDESAAELEAAATAASAIGSSWLLAFLYSNAAYNAIKAGHPARALELLERALPVAREREDPLVLAFVYGNVGVAALFTGDLDRARNALEEELRLCREHVWPEVAAEGLAGVAAIAICDGDALRGATLLGAASATGPIADADVASQFEQRFFESARQALGGSWSKAYADGAAMGFDEAIALALSGPMP